MVDRLERLVNLVIALRETRRPLTTAQINDRVGGYGGQRDEAWRRMFERDKADLRELGVPLRTEKLDRFDDTLGYRIAPEDYDLPSVALDPGELTALALAVQLTGLGDDAAPGLDKLAVDADLAGEQRTVPRLPLEMGIDAPNRNALAEALLTRSRVTFGYRKGADAVESPTRRRVEPHALLHHRGRWYLRGFDTDRRADRTFRLDRIEGGVKLTGDPGAVTIPDIPPAPRDVIPGAMGDPLDATLLASDAASWVVARRARGAGTPAAREGWREFTVRVTDADDFIGWLVELGPEVELVAPAQLRGQLVAHLRAVVS
ncbi:MAG TPA: WYL domain-containing protein [Euzebya sp.]|nr:WYL domain-containing protein [Euzebya sp.]